ncbi:Hypothetical predicted protein [Mytilus galloprovincialis]|uniref:Reverse transcriptase domain-containing protein n=1 Tax=Mytilus galloprovincialis TaxID=29158 RepID=A0A8B6H107_MYTGA|nr:Hypothetical predicted protein [Mytilus galloprovincialis]
MHLLLSNEQYNSKEMFTIDQGVRQGGAFSADLYKIYINPLINILSTSGLGGRVGNINCCAPTCADDVALVSNNPLELQTMINIVLDFSKREGYTVNANLKDFRKIPVRLKILTGNYILQTHKASFSKNNYISPTCKLCGKADETVEHFILLCEKLEETRIPLLSKILDNGSLILAKVATSFPIDLIQLIINPFCYVDINANRAVFEETSNILEPLCRQLLYNMHNKRYALLANIDKQGSRKSNF